jgi:hypothetical protein
MIEHTNSKIHRELIRPLQVMVLTEFELSEGSGTA